MPKVLCTLPNASGEISGVKFSQHEKGMLSDEVSDEQAEFFAAIPGYAIVGAKTTTTDGGQGGDDAEREALEAKAKELGVATKKTWGIDRLKSEIAAAEQAAADSAAK